MKNLTRVLALVLVFSLMLGSVAFAGTFTDVSSDSANAEAISVLADLGILKGYEDGSFGPEKVITRAEVVAVINRLQGLEQAAKGNAGRGHSGDRFRRLRQPDPFRRGFRADGSRCGPGCIAVPFR